MASLRAPACRRLLLVPTRAPTTFASISTLQQRRTISKDASSQSLAPTTIAAATVTPGTVTPDTVTPETTSAPNWDAPIDKATSTYTPVPHQIQDGSEPNILPAAVVSGAPMELQARQVRIFKPAKPATQSGEAHTHGWRMDWDVLSKGHRWENPLMGWQSSADFMQGTHLSFSSKEAAIAFAEKNGYPYFVQEPKQRAFVVKNYANNFLYSPGKLKHIRTK